MRYHWARRGDVNAFFGLMLDNVAVMVILVGLIASARPLDEQAREGFVHFTSGFVLTHMIPGTALGVLLGDLVYSWMAFRLARKTGRPDVTAMPLGLDTPSTFGSAFLVLLPALQEGFATFKDHEKAMTYAWHVGLMVLVLVGVFKMAVAPLGNLVRRFVPRAGLLGSLAAIALALIAFLPLAEKDGIAAVPVVGLAALVVILITLVAHRQLPGKFPGALAAVLIGVALFQTLYWLGYWQGWPLVPAPEKGEPPALWQPESLLSFYGAGAGWWATIFWAAVAKLPVALPFALATIVGGIDCTESAAAAGDEYDTRAILFTEGMASFTAGLLGGVIQTTPYIGHPAYKKMGGRTAYTLSTAVFVGAVGCCGGFTFLFPWLPKAAMFPILVFVGLEITAQSFQATPTKHYPAVALAILPALAYLCVVVLKNTFGLQTPDREDGVQWLQTLRCLSNGFLISGLLWAAALALLLDGRLSASAAFLGLAGVCAFFGVIHSPLADEQIGLPYYILESVQKQSGGTAFWKAVQYQTPYHWAAAYGLAALMVLSLSLKKEPPQRDKEDITHAEKGLEARIAPGAAAPPDEGIAQAPGDQITDVKG
jgi:AGZA family xanthine/uracil permease-like MFS transporter